MNNVLKPEQNNFLKKPTLIQQTHFNSANPHYKSYPFQFKNYLREIRKSELESSDLEGVTIRRGGGKSRFGRRNLLGELEKIARERERE